MTEATPQVDLNLDELLPASKTVLLNGRTLVVNAPKFGDMVKLFAVAGRLKTIADEADPAGLISELKQAFVSFIPDLAENDLTLPQLNSLMAFVFSMVTPAEQKELAEAGIELNTEKKTSEEPSSSSSPTS